jgi:hypothetical protein
MSPKIRFAQLGDQLGVPLLNDWSMAEITWRCRDFCQFAQYWSDAPVSRRNIGVGGNAQLTACGVRSEAAANNRVQEMKFMPRVWERWRKSSTPSGPTV